MKKIFFSLFTVVLIVVLIVFSLRTNRVGTGLLWGDSPYIITHYHLVRDASAITVRLYNENPTPARLTAWDEDNNLALLKIQNTIGGVAPLIPLGDSSLIKVGESVFTLGYPLINTIGDRPRLAQGTVESHRGPDNYPNLFQISVVLQTGNSGVPLFNRQAELIGLAMTAAEVRRLGPAGDIPPGVNFAVKSKHLRKLLASVPGGLMAGAPRQAVSALDEAALKKFIRKIGKNIVLVEASVPLNPDG